MSSINLNSKAAQDAVVEGSVAMLRAARMLRRSLTAADPAEAMLSASSTIETHVNRIASAFGVAGDVYQTLQTDSTREGDY